jgi:starvation-inducible DNA-binding protein
MALVDELKTLQANVFNVYSQAHGYHWNVEGIMFKQFHAFFGEIYDDIYGSIDPISENIRKLGGHAPFGPMQWLSNSTIQINDSHNMSALDMVRELIVTNNALIAQLMQIFEVANAENQQGIANFIADRIDKHQFWNWQLTSSLKVTTT